MWMLNEIYFFLFLFSQLVGLGLFAFSIWIRVEPGFEEWVQILDIYSYYIGVYILILVSVLVLITSFLGCCSALMEHGVALMIVSIGDVRKLSDFWGFSWNFSKTLLKHYHISSTLVGTANNNLCFTTTSIRFETLACKFTFKSTKLSPLKCQLVLLSELKMKICFLPHIDSELSLPQTFIVKNNLNYLWQARRRRKTILFLKFLLFRKPTTILRFMSWKILWCGMLPNGGEFWKKEN